MKGPRESGKTQTSSLEVIQFGVNGLEDGFWQVTLYWQLIVGGGVKDEKFDSIMIG